MYYAKELFVKRGPLSTLWLAGSIFKKVGKQTIVQADITNLCGVVISPPVALALPTQSTLLRGVCRIENKKAVYLLEDAEHASSRLLAQKPARETTILDPKRMRARHETITMDESEQGERGMRRGEEFEAGMDDYSLLVEQTDDMQLMDDTSESRLHAIDDAAYTARAEDITLMGDIGLIGEEGLGAFDTTDEMQLIDDTGDELIGGGDFDVGGDFQLTGDQLQLSPRSIAASQAASELEGMDLDNLALPVRARKGKKGKKAFEVQMDEDMTEITDAALRIQLHDVHDIIVSRPEYPYPYDHSDSMDEALRELSSFAPPLRVGAPSWCAMFARLASMQPVIDDSGRVQEADFAEADDAGWGMAGDAGMYAEEERQADQESVATGAELDDASRSRGGLGLDDTIDGMADMSDVDRDGGLFANLSASQSRSGDRLSGTELGSKRDRQRDSRRFEVVSDMETPDVDVSDSQFDLQTREESVKMRRGTIDRKAIDKHTEIIRAALDTAFQRLTRTGDPLLIVFDPFLQSLVDNDPLRRDRALAFYQLLVLTSFDIIRVSQKDEYGDIEITKGDKYSMRQSQMTPSGSRSGSGSGSAQQSGQSSDASQ